MDSEQLSRQIILDHYNNPKNKVNEKPSGYIARKGINPSCGDELELYVKLNGKIVEDVKFNGEGCSICCSSASVLTIEAKGLEKFDVVDKVNEFSKMLKGNAFKDDVFEDAIAFLGTSKFPARYKCAFLSWQTLKEIFELED